MNAQAYAAAWRGDPPMSDDPDYMAAYNEGEAARRTADARGGRVNAALRNHRAGPRPSWSPAPHTAVQEPQEVVGAVG